MTKNERIRALEERIAQLEARLVAVESRPYYVSPPWNPFPTWDAPSITNGDTTASRLPVTWVGAA